MEISNWKSFKNEFKIFKYKFININSNVDSSRNEKFIFLFRIKKRYWKIAKKINM